MPTLALATLLLICPAHTHNPLVCELMTEPHGVQLGAYGVLIDTSPRGTVTGVEGVGAFAPYTFWRHVDVTETRIGGFQSDDFYGPTGLTPAASVTIDT